MIVVSQTIVPWWFYAGSIVVLALGVAYECAKTYEEEPIPQYYLGP